MIDPSGNYIGTANCGNEHHIQQPDPPYGKQDDVTNTLYFEDGFKEVIGYLTEGRYLVLEKAGAALTNKPNRWPLTTSPGTELHNSKSQRWVLNCHGGEESGIFIMSSALDGRWLGARGKMLPSDEKPNAEPVRIKFLGNGRGHLLQYANGGEFIDINHVGGLKMRGSQDIPDQGYTIFSVSYYD